MNQEIETKHEEVEQSQQPEVQQQPPKAKRGRKPKYQTKEEKAEAQRVQSLKYYYRQKAKLQQLKENRADPTSSCMIEIKVTALSGKLGKIDEVVKYKVLSDGELLKIQE